jgi:mono/diheme cytochrome c family protein
VRQHGVEPLTDLHPVVEARSGRLEVREAARTDAGRYLASLTLPEPGNWTITIRSGFGNSRLTLLPIPVVPRGSVAPAPLAPIERGRLLFAAKGCVGCHVRNELGGAEDAPNFGPDLTGKTFEPGLLNRWLADPASMGPPRYGRGPMPNPRLKPAEIAALSAYLNSPR